MIIAFGCDHAGFPFRADIIAHLEMRGHTVVDQGAYTLEALDDFPDYSTLVCDTLIKREAERGVLVCGTGIGMSIAANRHPGIRAALLYNAEIAKISRSHNDANVACFGARTMTIESVLQSLDIFLSEPFIGDKYEKRNEKIDLRSC